MFTIRSTTDGRGLTRHSCRGSSEANHSYDAEGDFWYAAGATWNAPERVIADAPKPGTYMVYVNGYQIFGEIDGDRNEGSRAAKTDAFELKLYLE